MKISKVALVAILFSVGQALATPIFVVVPSSSPNGYGSPSYSAWVDNSINALYLGDSTYGNSALPSYYSQAPASMDVSQNIVTGFPSWNGQANPGTAYASELGNRVAFGFVLTAGSGEKLSIDKLGFSMLSTDASNSLNYTYTTGSYVYNSSYRGLLYGADGQLGGGDDTWVTSGSSSQLVDAIFGRGSGNAWASYSTDLGATNQDKIDGVVAAVLAGSGPNGFDFTGVYNYGTVASGSATVHFNGPASVPDSGTTASLLMFATFGLIVAFRRFR